MCDTFVLNRFETLRSNTLTETKMNGLECPSCHRDLSREDRAWVETVLRLSPPWSFTFMNPDGWRELSCKHGLEVMVDRTQCADRIRFHLEGRPVLMSKPPGTIEWE